MDVEAATAANMPTIGHLLPQLTRRQLHDLVWDTPIDVLAATYDISNVGLAKTCHRFDASVPPRGCWQKLAAGISVPLSKLSAPRDVNDDVVIATLHTRIKRTEPKQILRSAFRNQRAYGD